MRRYIVAVCWLIFVFGLTGCVQYDLGIQFDYQLQGRIVQHVHVRDRIAILSAPVVQDWFTRLDHQAKQLGGKTQPIGNTDLDIVIPFRNAAELEQRFNQFFQMDWDETMATSADFPQLMPHLSLSQRNYFVAVHNHLTLSLDDSSADNPNPQGFITQPATLLSLTIKLTTPWGLQPLSTSAEPTPNSADPKPTYSLKASESNWSLTPESNQIIDVEFWLPNPIGIGTSAIALMVALGYWLKYGWKG